MEPFNKHTHFKILGNDDWYVVQMNVAVRVTIYINKGKYDRATAVYRKGVPLSSVLAKLETYKTWDTTKSHPGNFTIESVGNCYDFKDGQLYSTDDGITTWETPHAN